VDITFVLFSVCDLLGQGYGGFISFVGCPNAHVLNMQSKFMNDKNFQPPNAGYDISHCSIDFCTRGR
jgi:hypothetical protein